MAIWSQADVSSPCIEEDRSAALKPAFDEGDLTIMMHDPATLTKGYQGILLACARCKK